MAKKSRNNQRRLRKQDLTRIGDHVWEVPPDFREDMRAPARFYSSDRLIDDALRDDSPNQLINTATLPGIVGAALAMPDMHQGYGFPIGGVVATRMPDGVISPGGVGYDINCGVRVAVTNIDAEEAEPIRDEIAAALFTGISVGIGRDTGKSLGGGEFTRLLIDGAQWAVKNGYGTQEDVEHTESRGKLHGADPDALSKRAIKRGQTQSGSLGGGNHFVEVDIIDQIYDEEAADAFGLVRGRIAVQIHTGSRGFGHQVATDYVREFQNALSKYGIKLPDRSLVCAPANSPEGKRYLAAMRAAANFAFANRQILLHQARRAFEHVFGPGATLRMVYDVAHNIAKLEKHTVDGEEVEVLVHRKGATRAFGPNHPEVPADYRTVGQPVLVPGSMGTGSWILVGTDEAMKQTFGSSCHGAGRVMSRSAAKRKVRGTKLREELIADGIAVEAGSMAGLAEEAPLAYKDVDDVVSVVSGAGIARKVAHLTPIAVIKG